MNKLFLILCFALLVQSVQGFNGFDVSNSSIPRNEILPGGPPRDGIPALNYPKFISAKQANYLQAQDRVLGIFLHGIAKAYPIRILNHHEIVNDLFKQQAVVVSYCPLCGTGVAFDASVDRQSLQFGVSGLLYNSDVLLYDRQSQSLWSQILTKAISGPKKGKQLKMIAMRHSSWRDWQQRHPSTVVLSLETGYNRDYSRSPYGNYDLDKSIYFPVAHQDPRYHPKERILGVEINGKYKAYPFSELSKASQAGRLPIKDKIWAKNVKVHFDRENASAWLEDAKGKLIPSIDGFWFAWMAFHPQSQVYQYNE